MGIGEDFEEKVAEYYIRRGFQATLTKHTQDFGADIILYFNHKKIVVQAKYLTDGKVSVGAVQEVHSAIKHYNADEGWVITNSTFTTNARQLADSCKIKLIENFYDDKSYPIKKKRLYESFTDKPVLNIAITNNPIVIIGIILLFVFIGIILIPSLIATDEDRFNSFVESGDYYLLSKKYVEAINKYDLALSIHPNNAMVWFAKGACYSQLNRSQDAINSYNNATKINPNLAIAWDNKGVDLLKLNRNKEACQAFEKAFALAPTDPLIQSNHKDPEVKKKCNF